MELNESPFIPIMGEIHYTRIPNEQWEEQILKVKSGGVNVICTYVFWNIHEETEGVFDWDGDKDLRKFISLCQKHNMKTLVRIGPFCHGEIRNGGIPDWLYGRPFLIRTNDREYLKYVDRLYAEISIKMGVVLLVFSWKMSCSTLLLLGPFAILISQLTILLLIMMCKIPNLVYRYKNRISRVLKPVIST